MLKPFFLKKAYFLKFRSAKFLGKQICGSFLLPYTGVDVFFCLENACNVLFAFAEITNCGLHVKSFGTGTIPCSILKSCADSDSSQLKQVFIY